MNLNSVCDKCQIHTSWNDAKQPLNKVAELHHYVSERSKRIDDTLDRLQIIKENKLKSLGYTFPPDYTPTEKLFERLKRSLRMNYNMVQETKVRDDLNDESTFLFFTTLAIASILQLVIFANDPDIVITNTTIAVIVVFAHNFTLGYSFVFIVSIFMKLLLPPEKGLPKQDVLRILSYPFTIYLVNFIFGVLRVLSGQAIFSLLSLIFLILFFTVMIVTVRYAYDTNNLYAIFAVIVPYTMAWLVIAPLVSFILGIFFISFT